MDNAGDDTIINWELQEEDIERNDDFNDDDEDENDDDDEDDQSWVSNEEKRPTNAIQWRHGEACLQFIEAIETRVFHPGVGDHCLQVEEVFLSAFLDLDDDEVRQVGEALRSVKDLDNFHIMNIRYPESQAHQLRFQQLFQLLGELSNITRAFVHIPSYDDDEMQAIGRIIGLLRQVAILTISAAIYTDQGVTLEQVGDSLRHIANGLDSHPSIRQCRLDNIPPLFYSVLLPVMQTIPHLQLICLEAAILDTGGYIPPLEAAAIRDLLHSDRPELSVELQNHSFTNSESLELLCHGVETLGIGKIDLGYLQCGPGGHRLVDAFVASNMRHLSLQWLAYLETSELTAATAALMRGLPTMARLESITCELGVYEDSVFKCDAGDDTIVAVVRAAAQCTSLKKLSLSSVVEYTRDLDDAFFHCITSNHCLQEVAIEGQPTFPQMRCPGLLRALKQNYWVEHIHLMSSSWGEPGEVWDRGDELMIDVILRLNRSNRRYLHDEASNKHVGTQVLADVGNDMDCIYYHLLENPLLVVRKE